MKKLCKLGSMLVAAATVVFAPSAFANTLTFQGVTFETAASGNTLTLTITNALSGGTGNWANIQYLKAFEVKDIGNVTSATLSGWTTDVNQGLSASSGCTTGGTPGACFYQASAVALSDSMIFAINFVGTNLDLSAPSLKVQFLTNASDAKATGSLLSQTISPIPEPEIYAMLAVGLGVLGWSVNRKKSQSTAPA